MFFCPGICECFLVLHKEIFSFQEMHLFQMVVYDSETVFVPLAPLTG